MEKAGDAIAAAAATATAAKKTLFGSSLFGSMVIFDDPAYIIISLIGAVLSTMSAHYDLSKVRDEHTDRGEEFNVSVARELIKAFIVGLLITSLSFIIFIEAGGEALKSAVGVDWFANLMPSFWFILTLILSTMSLSLYDRITVFVKGGKK